MKPTKLVLKPSRRLAYILALVSLFASVLVICLPFTWLCKAALLLMIIPVTAYATARDALLILPWSCHLLTLNKDNEIVVTQKNGKKFVVKILPTSLVMPQLTVINMRAKGQLWSRNMILLADNADVEEARLWRVWLKWGLKD
jgi:hypothetical protein